MSFPRRVFGPLVQARTYRESAHLLINLGVGIATFTVAVTMLALSAGLLITLIGLPLLVATVFSGRVIAVVGRWRARVFLDDDPPAYAAYALDGTWWNKAKQALGDKAGWKGLVYGLLMLPWGIATFTATVVVWSVAVWAAVFPAVFWLIPEGDDYGPFNINGYVLTGGGRVGAIAAVGAIGWLLLALTPRLVHGMAGVDRHLIRGLLSPGHEAELEQRVSELRVSRDASVESSASELRRIERDLHDGAQQRLVSLAMNLGLAKDKLSESDDPQAVALVARAHDDAKQAIVELRDLVRGIHPAVLTDRGLDAAVSALAARCVVPVEVRYEVGRRLPAPIEAAAYFVIAEALTNIDKHSRATAASVRLAERDGYLVVEVYDNGVGGAIEAANGGLRGLRDRIAGVEGRLRVASPVGGPTFIIAELPCAL